MGLTGWILFLVGLGMAVGYNTSIIGISLLIPGLILIIIPFFSKKIWISIKNYWNSKHIPKVVIDDIEIINTTSTSTKKTNKNISVGI
jgi:hypothetical protein